MRSEEDLSHALWLMRLSYLRYALKTSTDPEKLFAQESEELRLSPRFKSLLEPFVPLTARQALATSIEAMRQIAEFIAVLACSLFAGAATYISVVEHPARMECGVEVAATEFAPSFRRATIMQASLAALGLVSSIAAWLAGATFWWLVGGILLGSVILFTLVVILPTNKQLLSPTLNRESAQTERLLARWAALHAVRSVLSGVSLLLFLYLAIFAKSA